jgi:hypothetical protein
VRADIGRDHHLALEAIDHQRLIEQFGPERHIRHLARDGYRIPVAGKNAPVVRGKGAAVRQGRSSESAGAVAMGKSLGWVGNGHRHDDAGAFDQTH